ncbi:MAG: CDP-glycerol glycerophosphotransferase family protein [Anaerovoracaceae bacterium]
MAIVTIEDLKFSRSIFHCEGKIKECDISEIKRFYLKDKTSGEEVDIPNIKYDGTSYYMTLHVLAAKEEYPITSGQWYLSAQKNNGENIEVKVSDKVYDKVHLSKFDGDRVDAIFDKSASNYFHCYSRINIKTLGFYFLIDYVIPTPETNILKIWLKNVYSRHKKRMRAIKKAGFVYIFKFFNKKTKTGNKVLFTSSSRSEIGGNEKFVYDRMIQRGMDKDYEFRFDYKASIDSYRSIRNKLLFTYYLATSDYIFLDDYQPEIYKNDYDKNVKIIQLWHACGAFKTLGFERLDAKGAPGFTTRVHKCYTHVPVSSEHSVKHHAEAFAIDENKFYPIGIARTDVFFDEEYKEKTKQNIYKEFPQILDATKVIMYAPTFRGNNAKDAYFPVHMLNFKKLGKFLERINGLMIIKMHPFVNEEFFIPNEYKKYFIDASTYREVNDLLLVSDVLVTDYSSVIYEMSLLKKPMIFYAFDIDTYEKDRGFYEPYKDIIPGEIVKSIDHLIEVLENDQYDDERLNWFLKKNFKYTDGNATDRIIDLVFNNVNPE